MGWDHRLRALEKNQSPAVFGCPVKVEERAKEHTQTLWDVLVCGETALGGDRGITLKERSK